LVVLALKPQVKVQGFIRCLRMISNFFGIPESTGGYSRKYKLFTNSVF